MVGDDESDPSEGICDVDLECRAYPETTRFPYNSNVRDKRLEVEYQRESEHNAIVIIKCRREQVLDIIEHVKSRFPNVSVSYEIPYEE